MWLGMPFTPLWKVPVFGTQKHFLRQARQWQWSLGDHFQPTQGQGRAKAVDFAALKFRARIFAALSLHFACVEYRFYSIILPFKGGAASYQNGFPKLLSRSIHEPAIHIRSNHDIPVVPVCRSGPRR